MPGNEDLDSIAREAVWDYIMCPNAHPMKEELKSRAIDLYCEMYMSYVEEDEKIDRMMAL